MFLALSSLCLRVSVVKGLLLGDHSFHQISRAIYVVSLLCGHMIGEQLQGNHFNDRQQQFGRGRNKEYVIGNVGYLVIPFGGDRHQPSTARLHFLHHFEGAPVAQNRIRIVVVARCQHHDRKVFVDQRVGPVLQFARRVAFCMSIRDFLELERTFARDGVVYASSEVEELFGVKMLLSELFRKIVPGPEIVFDRIREASEPLQVRARDLRGHAAAFSRQE